MRDNGRWLSRSASIFLLCGLLHALSTIALPADPLKRPLLITIDDLPISQGKLHPDPAERAEITRRMLGVLSDHGVKAVGLVTWSNVRDETDLKLLELWLDAGHELSNHSYTHPDLNTTPTEEFIADVERARVGLRAFLEARDSRLRFFRFPLLHEGDSLAKLNAMRDYLEGTEQRKLPVTIDNPDYAFEKPWVEAARRADTAAMLEIGEDYQATLRIAVRHHERTGDKLFGRTLPQILLLHAGEVGTAQWDALFDWLERTGHRFASADEVLADPVFAEPDEFVTSKGFSLWDRLSAQNLARQAYHEINELLQTQAGAWNRADLEAFCSVYAEDAAFVSPSGLTRGRQQILERYKARYLDKDAMGELSLQILEFNPASGIETSMLSDSRPSRIHGASVIARWEIAYAEAEDLSGLTLLVLRREGNHWRIVQDASM